MPGLCAYQFIIVALKGTDDSNSLIHILTVVIMLAVVVIGNIAQAKKTQKKTRARHLGDQPPPGDYESEQQMEDTLERARRKNPRPAAYAPGGFGEVLEEDDIQTLARQTALERFVAMKDVPVEKLERSPVTAISGLNSEDDDYLEKLDIHEETFEIAGVDGSAAIFAEDELALDLSFENLGDAILYGEILGKPVALRGTDRAGSGSI